MLARLDALAGKGVLLLARPNPIPVDLGDATGVGQVHNPCCRLRGGRLQCRIASE